ncbi:hypothetical protein [Paraburkholderia dipogonis]|uniref:hypothetical protein n=1 Tax=Paraburkholderia dipogonis TaxID=1211383 RepID=UPI001FCBE372|nr:hypothetical protein [Paraburkholderia dipogonis]
MVDVPRQPVQGGRMRIKPMVSRVAGNDSDIHAAIHRVVNCERETPVRLIEVFRRVMQVRHVSDFHVAS